MYLLQLVQILLQLEKAVPMRVVRCTHHCALASTTPLMVPQVVVSNLELVRPGIFLEQVFLSQFFEHLRGRLVIGHVIQLHRLVTLGEEAISMPRGGNLIFDFVGGLADDLEEKNEFSTKEVRRSRFEMLFKDYEVLI